ncbi:Protein EPD1 [Smittium culicis]|uniref:1,3-beta-glucanosyltransferase n=2 Tax=Smittium culicis TaxID=133412 RepID=A0A1R1Y5A7_9FUNG|nr:Protein EPD1 [Smittium culicis]
MKISLILPIACIGLAYGIDPLIFKGSKVFNAKTGDQFYFKGVAYQPKKGSTSSPQDPLVDEIGCKRDISKFQDLGINAIRVYEVDSSKNHDFCMNALKEAGIYVLLDLPTPSYSIRRENPSWDIYLLNKFKQKVDAFSKYENVAGFIAGNEVANSVNTTPSAAFVKASIRDIKKYMKAKKINLPVGYVDNDDLLIREPLIKYFNCGSDSDALADFYGINTYRWCGENSYKGSAYDALIAPFSSYSVPYMITEYGCNNPTPRPLNEIQSIYGSDMKDLSSGGFLFEYSNEPNNYGIVDVSYGDPNVSQLPDYSTFKKMLANVSPKGVNINSYNPDLKPSSCPPSSDKWLVGDVVPPSPNIDLCNCLSKTFSCMMPPQYSPADDVQAVVLQNHLDSICKTVDCSDILTDTIKGTYGKYSGCTTFQKASLIISRYYDKMDRKAGQCFVSGLDFTFPTNNNPESIDTCSNISGDSASSDPIPDMNIDGLASNSSTNNNNNASNSAPSRTASSASNSSISTKPSSTASKSTTDASSNGSSPSLTSASGGANSSGAADAKSASSNSPRSVTLGSYKIYGIIAAIVSSYFIIQ